MPTLFTKILRGEIPSYKIHEDELTFAFLDINPIQGGHTLIVPKIEADHFYETPDAHYQAVMKAAQKLAPAIRKATGCTRVGLAVQGFEVPHFHLHMLPMWSPRDMDFTRGKKREAAEMKAIQEKIVEALGAAGDELSRS